MRKGRSTFGVGLEGNSESVFLRLDSFRFFKIMKKVLERDPGFQFQGSIKMKKKNWGGRGVLKGLSRQTVAPKEKKSLKAVSETGGSTARVKLIVGDLYVEVL